MHYNLLKKISSLKRKLCHYLCCPNIWGEGRGGWRHLQLSPQSIHVQLQDAKSIQPPTRSPWRSTLECSTTTIQVEKARTLSLKRTVVPCPSLPRYRGGRLRSRELQTHSPVPHSHPHPTARAAAPSRPLSPPGASTRRCPPPIRPEPRAASLTYTPGTGPASLPATSASFQLTFQKPKAFHKSPEKSGASFSTDHQSHPYSSAPPPTCVVPGPQPGPTHGCEDASRRCCPRFVRGPLRSPERRGRDGPVPPPGPK